MKAAWYEKNGEARDVLIYGDIDTPAPGSGEVLVRLHVSGVNPSDYKSRRTRPLNAPKIIPHSDGAGVIEAVGSGVSNTRVGERVWTWNAQWQRPYGTAAQYIALPSEMAVRLPDDTSFDAGACMGIPGLTAFEAVRRLGDIAGKTVLVIGASSVVGHYAAQMAVLKGARVIGTVGSEDKAGHAKEAGVSETINYKTENTAERVKALTHGKGTDFIVDMDFSTTSALLREGALASHGIVACYGSNSYDEPSVPFRFFLTSSIQLSFFLIYDLTKAERSNALNGISELLSSGKIKHAIGARFKLNEIIAAHETVEAGKLIGNVVIDCS